MKKSLKKLGLILAVNCLLAGFLFGQETTESTEIDEEEMIELDPFVLTEVTTVGYGTNVTSGGSRFNVDLLDLSHSVIPVNHELMDDVAAFDSEDALRYVAGIGPSSTVTIGTFFIRGFPTRGSNSSFLDGLPGPETEQETEFIERYEIIKGPVGTLYGDHSFGGLVNRIFKAPTKERQTTLKFLYSSIGDTVQGSVDHGGPIDKEGKFTYRFIGVVRDGEVTQGAGAADEKENFYATLQYESENGNTRMWGRGFKKHIKTGHETPGVFWDGAGRPSTDITGSSISTVPVPNNEQRDEFYAEFGFANRFSGLIGDWNFRLVTRYIESENNDPTADIIAIGYSFLRADGSVFGTTGTRSTPGEPEFADFGTAYTDIKMSNAVARVSGPGINKTWGLFTDLTGRFETGGLSHNLLIYSQFTQGRSKSSWTDVTIKEEFGGSALNANLNLDNAYSIITQNSFPLGESNDYYDFPPGGPHSISESDGNTRFNFGVQDNITLAEGRLVFSGGVRYDFGNSGGSTELLTGASSSGNKSNNWVSKFGFVGQVIDDKVSIYYNRSETFESRFGELVPGVPAKNLEGKINEVGVKLQFFDNSLLMTANWFKLDVLNAPIRIFNEETGLDESVQEGVTTSDGWEIDLAWRFNDNFTFLVALTDQETLGFNEETQDKTRRQRNGQNGFRWSGVAKYTFLEGGLRGLTTGVALVNLADRFGDTRSSFVTEGYTRADAFVSYVTKNGKLRLQVNINNFTDVVGTISSIFAALGHAEDPRHVKFSVAYTF